MVTWLVCVCVYIYRKDDLGRIEVYDKLRRATKQRFKSSWNRKDAFNNLGRGLKRFGLILQRTRGYPHHSTWLQLDHNYFLSA